MAGGVVILSAHGIGPAPRMLDPGEDRKKTSIEQFEPGLEDVRLTFDDGNACDAEKGLHRPSERELSAEFFVLAGLLAEPRRLDAADPRHLHEAGMRSGSHRWAHRHWRRIDTSLHSEEFRDSRRVLGVLTGGSVSRVAIPIGSNDRHMMHYLLERIEPIAVVEYKSGKSAGNPSRARERQRRAGPPSHSGLDRPRARCTVGRIATGDGRVQDCSDPLPRRARRIVSWRR
jgi:hypothetical protein